MVLRFDIFRQSRNLAQVIPKLQRSCRLATKLNIATIMDPQTIYEKAGTANMPYTHCRTRIVSLVDLNIPELATEAEYKQLYDQISKSGTEAGQDLIDAISSVSLGIAPPVAFPTETVYGLGADATNRASVAGIFAAKGRPSDNPLIVHIASIDQLERLIGEPLPSIYTDLVKDHWPGPLTILVPIPKDNSVFAKNVHPGQRTIGFRIPESKYARFFIAATGKPIAGPSANSSGKPSPTTAQHVMNDLNGKINFILDGGNCNVGVESTVVDGLCDPPLILRPGGLGQDDLIAHGKRYNNAWANVGIGYKQAHEGPDAKTNGTTSAEAPRAPGMKYKHYAPRGRMILFEGHHSAEKVRAELDLILNNVTPDANTNGFTNHSHDEEQPPQDSNNIAILTSTSWQAFADLPATININTTKITNQKSKSLTYRNHNIHSIPLGTNPKEIAQNLFAALRTCDDLKCRYILAEAPTREQILRSTTNGVHDEDDKKEEQMHQYDAVLERMRKAASLVVT